MQLSAPALPPGSRSIQPTWQAVALKAEDSSLYRPVREEPKLVLLLGPPTPLKQRLAKMLAIGTGGTEISAIELARGQGEEAQRAPAGMTKTFGLSDHASSKPLPSSR